ncbi:class I SAM-dependent methyltransferase [Dongia sp.]|uniref:class I SAM-dependent methyltransferase n=1 Tax=Dongia sp. TaxID=1977262 RepID=UPI0035B1E812
MSLLRSPQAFRTGRVLPGTRALRYFAGATCILVLLEALLAREPVVALAGLGLGLSIVFAAPWLVERNRRLARWPAAIGPGVPAPWLLRALGGVGLALALLDLGDLTENEPGLSYPIVQLSLPVLAFFAALLVSLRRVQPAPASADRRLSPQEESLRRACLAFLACGTVALGLSELAEHGVPGSDTLYLIAAFAGGLVLLGAFLRWYVLGFTLPSLPRSVTAPGAEDLQIPELQTPELQTPELQTLGVRVDGRVKWVDLLEDCMSFGQRRNILAATLAASRIGAGQNLLDIGCGTGELVVAAATIIADGGRARGGHAMGVDATPGMIDLARRRADLQGIIARFEVAVAESLPLPDGVIDGVTSSFFFHHLPSAVKCQALAEMWRVLAPGGRLVITDYGRPQNLLGHIASFPMRFNYHEHVRGQLGGELEAIIAAASIGTPRIERSFLGYINVMTLEKPMHPACADRTPSHA